ncbi:linoleate 9S-lipoxygenase 6 [Cryptomeria japonica]|uniref:linoleate 9S-lipoxygenase 6 n=1 Tax=Cryptomeria japonica TaxID=3369 RepID=UPI0027DA713E|nr:linoleate 9S-lipoxygenase 6 [Cryptomeria japonica]
MRRFFNNSSSSKNEHIKIEGTVVLRKASLMDMKDYSASFGDRAAEFLQRNVFFQLVSCDQTDNETGKGKVSPHKAALDWNWPGLGTVVKDTTHKITFEWPADYGTPGAILVKNKHAREFYLKHVCIHLPDQGEVNFLCNSWVYPTWMAKFCSSLSSGRIFFANNSYLPTETPVGLVGWRGEELVKMRGNGTGKREPWDRIYDYDVYNDLGDLQNGKNLERTIIGGSADFPYPRRCRTGRNRLRINHAYEGRKQEWKLAALVSPGFYIPADEKFPQASLSDFRAHFFKAFSKKFISDLVTNLNVVKKHFGNLKEVKSLYSKGLNLPADITISLAKAVVPFQMIKGILDTNDQAVLKFPKPNIINRDDNAWRTDEEFARQTLAGINPMVIKRLERFPPHGNLNPQIYGPQKSSITKEHLLPYLDEMSVEKAIEDKELFILDYYDAYMPYVERINSLPTSRVHASRTIFLFGADGTLRPIAIELCLPPTSVGQGDNRVFTPNYAEEDKGWLWELAKAHVRSNDSGYHQIVNHWLRTHAVVEPFIISTHRNLSKLHPLHKLLVPHFRNTMDINRAARESLINAEGIVEKCFSPGKFGMEISSKAYIDWKFDEQGLPADLKKRGMAVENGAGGLELVIKDYPYAVDGLEIWDALKSWVSEYLSLYYSDDESVESDEEVRAWWKEIREVGHGDKKHEEAGWYKMKSLKDLQEAITTLVWVASAHHAAVNFSQYDYAGFMPNLPSTTRKLVPLKGSDQYSKLLKDPETFFLKTLTDPTTATTTMAVLEILSRHSTDEVYLGQGSTKEWVDDNRVYEAYQKFRRNLLDIEKNIIARNEDSNLKNRCGAVKLPYTLLFPNTSDETKTGGLTFKGIPNSISI